MKAKLLSSGFKKTVWFMGYLTKVKGNDQFLHKKEINDCLYGFLFL